MTDGTIVHPGYRDTAAPRDISALGPLIVFACTTFNLGLAIVNSHGVTLNQTAVIAAEGALLVSAQFVILKLYQPEVRPWYALIFLVCTVAAYQAALTRSIDLKAMRDLLIIPTFVSLGIVCRHRDIMKMMMWIHLCVLAVAALEAANVNLYSALFNVKQFYVNTRGIQESTFWNTGSDLFVSAARPNERYLLPQLGIHRLSSVFLEPVSLGNYCIVATCFVCATSRFMSPKMIGFYIVTIGMLLVGCDGRLATVTSFAIVTMVPVANRTRYLSAIFLPTVLLIAIFVHYFFRDEIGNDNIAGRVAFTVQTLSHMTPDHYLGISQERISGIDDSGIAYLIVNNSVFAFLAVWVFLVTLLPEETREGSIMKNGALLYIASSMLVSNAFISVKTAALLWFLVGVLCASGTTPVQRQEMR